MIRFIIIIYNKYRIINIESCIKYFFVQRLGSLILLIYLYIKLNIFSYLGRIVLCYKVGGGPFYFWFPSVCINIGWWSCFFLIRLQKIIPIILISLFVRSIIWFMRLIRLVVGVAGRINQVRVKQLIAFSSIHHVGWMLIRFIIRDDFWIIYLLIYRIIILRWIRFLDDVNVDRILDLIKFEGKWIIIIILLNLGGIPPLIGFFLKWWSFCYFLEYEIIIIILLLLFSVIILYIYFRLIYDFVIGGIWILSWKVKTNIEKWIQYDVFILVRLCMGSFLGILFVYNIRINNSINFQG